MANELETESALDERRERMHRVRVGLTGLAVVLVLVFIATAVITRISDNAVPASGSIVNNMTSEEHDEPLADLGVTPGASNEAATEPAKP